MLWLLPLVTLVAMGLLWFLLRPKGLIPVKPTQTDWKPMVPELNTDRARVHHAKHAHAQTTTRAQNVLGIGPDVRLIQKG